MAYFSVPLYNAVVNAVITKIAGTTGTGGTAKMDIYTGDQPGGDEAPSGVLLCTISGIGWAAATNGTAVLASTAGYFGTAGTFGTLGTVGTAGWARISSIGDDGTFNIDADCGSGFEIKLNDYVIAEGAEVKLVTLPLDPIG